MKVSTTLKALFIITTAVISSCTSNFADQDKNKMATAICHVECTGEVSPKKYHQHTYSNGVDLEVKVGGIISSKESKSGDKSVLLTKKVQYGLNSKFKNVGLSEYFIISIWRKDKKRKAALAIQSIETGAYYKIADKAVEIGENGWERLEIAFEVPPLVSGISTYAYIGSSDSAYFDDLKIQRISSKQYKEYPNKEYLSLYFNDDKMERFEEFRAEAHKEGVHFSNGIWTKGILSNGNDVLPIKARFKGDWLDHLTGKKWSFRIKVRKKKTFNRLRQFSLQTTKSRNHLHEYLSHQLMMQEGLLTTRYDFSLLYINKENRGIYAIEEHFTKQLIESSLRREGPIVKFDEDPMWRNQALHFGVNKIKPKVAYPNYQVSRVIPFSSSKVIESEKLLDQFTIAQSLLYQYKNRTTSIDELFDVEKTAKFLALTDLHQGKHGRVWHNLRLYYNPINCKLEFINYDNYTDYYKSEDFKPTALIFKNPTKINIWHNLHAQLFKSKQLLNYYYNYLQKYSQDDFVTNFYSKHTDYIKKYFPIIKEEFPNYQVDSSFLLSNAATIRKYLPELRTRIDTGYFDKLELADVDIEFTQDYHSTIFPYYVNAYYSSENDKGQLLIENFNNRKIKPLALLNKDKRPIASIESPALEAYTETYSQTTLSIPYIVDAKFLEFEELDSNRKYIAEITPWAKNTAPSPYQKLISLESSNYNQLFEEKDDTLILNGQQTLTNKIIIPKDKVVIVKKGSKIDLINKAAIISYSAVQFQGTRNQPVLVTSSDQSSNGIAVLQAADKSLVNHTTFSNLNTFSYEGWNLSGAVNFYESEVNISNATFKSNFCEDALNIISSKFKVDSCHFDNIFADAFDSDFCTGTLSNSTFEFVGNDAIDFSTSQITINNCTMNNISDKGVSGGEGSTLIVNNCIISNCNIGAASKDLSKVTLNNVVIENSKYGLVLLQKKPEYGPASIETDNFELKNCEQDLLIEKKSHVMLNGEKIKGSEEKVAEMFY